MKKIEKFMQLSLNRQDNATVIVFRLSYIEVYIRDLRKIVIPHLHTEISKNNTLIRFR
jgi:hypothetical protein